MVPSGELPETRTDPSGNYRFEGLAWDKYTVYADDPEAGYSIFSTGVSDQGNPPEIVLSPEHPEATLDLRLPPKAGFVRIHLTNKQTGASIPGLEVTVMSSRAPSQLLFMLSCSSDRAVLIPPDQDLLRQLTWFDRAGKALGTIGTPRAFYDIEFSPDRKRLAASVASAGNIDVWTYDLTQGATTRFTFDPAAEFRGMWSPDGRSIMFNSTRSGHADLYRKSADGAGAEDQLYADTTEKYPVSWSRDAKLLLYVAGGGAQGRELRVLPLAPERTVAALKPQPFLRSSTFGQFSPDGRWVAYESNEAQPSEIYVVPFSRPMEKHQISPNGGARPRWRPDGKEIFYLTPAGQLMAAEVTIRGDAIEVSAVRAMFGGIPLGAGYFYDVSADGQRILAAVAAVNPGGPPPITLVENWTAALKK